MPNFCVVELRLLGRRKPQRLPRFGPLDVERAREGLVCLCEREEISDAVAAQAEVVLKAIEQAATP